MAKPIESELHVPSMVEVPPRRKNVVVEGLCQLHNRGEQPYVVSADSAEAADHWHVLNAQHREIARQRSKAAKARAKLHPALGRTIPAGQSISHAIKLEIPADKLRDGQSYHVRCVCWGQVAEAEFVAVKPKKKARKSRGK